MPTKHALLSASSSERWIHCPPSARLSESYEDKGSDYAAEGTDAHSLCEFKLKTALGMEADNPTEGLTYYDQEMDDCATGYAAYVLEQVEAAKEVCSDPVVLIEQRVDFSRWVEQGFGTADCIIIADGTLQIIDFKYGLGVLVSAEENPQMMCYALGALELQRVLMLRQQLAKSSVKKYQAMINAVCADSRARGMFQFYGANRTGRWAGRLIQLQNLPQNHLADLADARSLVRSGDYDSVEMLYEDVPDTLSQLIRTAFIPKDGNKLIVSDFSAIEARVIAWMAGENWRQEVFAKGGDIYCASASQMFKVPVEKHGINGHLRQKGKIAELALGYGGSVGALKAMGALEMGLTEDELPQLVDAWRQSNPRIVAFWWDVDRAAMEAVKYHHATKTHGILFTYRSGMLFITLPSGRNLAYVKPKVGTNKFGGECITYEGVGGTKKWERLDSYGPKFVENIVQATSRDILCYAMKTLRCCSIVMHIHDELVIEADPRISLDAVCEQMGRTPPWAKGLQLRADGYETEFYKKD